MANNTESLLFSAETYFSTQSPPPNLDEIVGRVKEFVWRHKERGTKVVLITSGGTTVPLEMNVVRFLDNFSAGTRGATSAEYFLRAGYAVIFMHRQFSLQPFSRHYSHSTNPFLDLLQVSQPDPAFPPGLPTTSGSASSATASQTPPEITVLPEKRKDLLTVLQAYQAVQRSGTLHTLTFVTVNDYLWLLRALSQEMSILGRSAMYYLAAAVSDFFLPTQKMSEHKIQSGKGSLHIEMDQVPKILKPLVNEWTRGGYIVSFKLETDRTLLIPKAKQSLARYGHQVVIGNDLHSRKYEVVFVSPSRSSPPPSSPPSSATTKPSKEDNTYVQEWVRLSEAQSARGVEIEEAIIQQLVERHQAWTANA